MNRQTESEVMTPMCYTAYKGDTKMSSTQVSSQELDMVLIKNGIVLVQPRIPTH